MSYQVLARKWRPRNFSELVGQEHVVSAISNALDNNRLHHAYLFTGTRGVGKTTIARIFSKSLNCEEGMSSTPCGKCGTCLEIESGNFVDLLEIDAASRTKVEDTRELLDNVQYKPTRGEYKVYLIDEVHMLSKHSFNALLKTLEEPPPHVKFLLATTDPQKLPITILSRCLQFNLKALSRTQISEQLGHILEQEQLPFETGAIAQLARAAQGSMRDALSLTDQAIAQGNGKVTTDIVVDMLGLMDKGQILKLVHAVLNKDASGVMQQVESLSYQAPDYSQVISEILSLLHQVALTQFVPDACKLETVSARAVFQLSKLVSAEQIQLLYQIALQGKRDLPFAADGRSGLEMALLRMLAFSPAGVSVSSDALQELAEKETRAGANDAPSNQATTTQVQPQASVKSGASNQEVSVPAREAPVKDEDSLGHSPHMSGEKGEQVETQPHTRYSGEASEMPPPALENDNFDHQMLDSLEQQQQQIIEQAESFHPQQHTSHPSDSQVEQAIQTENTVEQSAPVSLSATEGLLALRQKVTQSASSAQTPQKEQDSSVKKPLTENDVPFNTASSQTQGTQAEPVEEQFHQAQQSQSNEQPLTADKVGQTSLAPEPELQSGENLVVKQEQQEKEQEAQPEPKRTEQLEPPWQASQHAEPMPVPSSPGENTAIQHSAVEKNEDTGQSPLQPPWPVSPEAEEMPFPAPAKAETVQTENAGNDGQAASSPPLPLQPPWPVSDPSVSHVPAGVTGRSRLPDGSQFMEPAEDFDPNSHLQEEIEVEVDFEVPAFLENGAKVIAATQLDTWSSLIEQMQITALTKQLALHSSYAKVEDKVTLTLLENKQHLISDTAVSQLTQALCEVLQQPINLEIVLEQPINTPFAVQQTINRVRYQYAHHVVETDEAMVNLKNTFAASLIEGSVKAR